MRLGVLGALTLLSVLAGADAGKAEEIVFRGDSAKHVFQQ